MRIQMPGSSLAPRTCIVCGATFIGGPSAKCCPDCRIERRRENDRRHKARKRAGKSIILGQTVGRCEKCGKEFVYTAGIQKYCPDCSKEAIRENDRKSMGGSTPMTAMPTSASAGRRASTAVHRSRLGIAQIKITAQRVSGSICGMQGTGPSASGLSTRASPSATARGRRASADTADKSVI